MPVTLGQLNRLLHGPAMLCAMAALGHSDLGLVYRAEFSVTSVALPLNILDIFWHGLCPWSGLSFRRQVFACFGFLSCSQARPRAGSRGWC